MIRNAGSCADHWPSFAERSQRVGWRTLDRQQHKTRHHALAELIDQNPLRR